MSIVALAFCLVGCADSANCSANGTCNPECQADPDCGEAGCVVDDDCNPNCPPGADKDCGEAGCVADDSCNRACPAGTDPDCSSAVNKANWPGFNAAAGTVRGKNYQVSGALVPGEYGKTAEGANSKATSGVRRTE